MHIPDSFSLLLLVRKLRWRVCWQEFSAVTNMPCCSNPCGVVTYFCLLWHNKSRTELNAPFLLSSIPALPRLDLSGGSSYSSRPCAPPSTRVNEHSSKFHLTLSPSRLYLQYHGSQARKPYQTPSNPFEPPPPYHLPLLTARIFSSSTHLSHTRYNQAINPVLALCSSAAVPTSYNHMYSHN